MVRLENYKEDRPNGKWLTWYNVGTLESEINYKDGVKEGTMKFLEKNGKVIYEAVYKKNKLVNVIVDNTKKEQ